MSSCQEFLNRACDLRFACRARRSECGSSAPRRCEARLGQGAQHRLRHAPTGSLDPYLGRRLAGGRAPLATAGEFRRWLRAWRSTDGCRGDWAVVSPRPVVRGEGRRAVLLRGPRGRPLGSGPMAAWAAVAHHPLRVPSECRRPRAVRLPSPCGVRRDPASWFRPADSRRGRARRPGPPDRRSSCPVGQRPLARCVARLGPPFRLDRRPRPRPSPAGWTSVRR